VHRFGSVSIVQVHLLIYLSNRQACGHNDMQTDRQNAVEEISSMDVSFKNSSIRSSLSSLYKNYDFHLDILYLLPAICKYLEHAMYCSQQVINTR